MYPGHCTACTMYVRDTLHTQKQNHIQRWAGQSAASWGECTRVCITCYSMKYVQLNIVGRSVCKGLYESCLQNPWRMSGYLQLYYTPSSTNLGEWGITVIAAYVYGLKNVPSVVASSGLLETLDEKMARDWLRFTTSIGYFHSHVSMFSTCPCIS